MEAQTALSGAKAWMLLLGAAVGVSVLVYLGLHREAPERNAGQRASAPALGVDRASSEVLVQPSAEGVNSAEASRALVPGSEDLLGVVIAEVPGAPTRSPELRAPPARKTGATVRSSTDPATAQSVAGSVLRSDPDAEIALVTGAQSLMVRRPNEALALLTEHERRFPHGLLAQERDTLRIDAERALGRRARALEHARAFVAQFPDSPQARAIKRWLAAEDNAASDHNPLRAPVLTP
jgi:hypothetical protein